MSKKEAPTAASGMEKKIESLLRRLKIRAKMGLRSDKGAFGTNETELYRRRVCLVLALISAFMLAASSLPAAWLKESPRQTILELPINLEQAKTNWNMGPNLKIVRDAILGRDVIEQSGAAGSWIRSRHAVNEPCEIVAELRFTDAPTTCLATLGCGAGGSDVAPDTAYSATANFSPSGPKTMIVSASFGSAAGSYLNNPVALKGNTARIRLPAYPGIYFRELFPNISPVMDEDFRQELETAMSKVPLVTNTWFELRIVHRPEALQVYKDGFLVAERQPAGRFAGDVYLKLSDKIRVASLTVRRLGNESDGFVPVRIDDRCNAQALGDKGAFALRADSLPAAGSRVAVEGIPFDFSQRRNGMDHVDVGESLFHHRNQAGGFQADTTWPGPSDLDPSRIAFSVPNRPYARLWVIAASDGDANRVPIVTARFYRPGAGFPIDAVGNVPPLRARSGPKEARRLPVKLADGKDGNLWLVPIDLDAARIASEFRDETFMSVELTKQVFGYRTYPDPCNYSWLPGGLPSGARIFAMTFEEAPIRLTATGNRWGNAYVAPEEPVWRVSLENLRGRKMDARVSVTVTDPYGQEAVYERGVNADPQTVVQIELPIAPKVYGLHQVRTDVHVAGLPFDPRVFSQRGALIQLPPDTRQSAAGNSRWGFWNWMGAHGTNPDEAENLYINRAAGARFARTGDLKTRGDWGIVTGPAHAWVYGPAPWSLKDPYDPKEYAAYGEELGKSFAAMYAKDPDLPSVSIFSESAISERITYGIPAEYIGEGETVMTTEEQARFRGFMLTLKAGTEGIRKLAPKAKIALGWCEPYFAAPFLKEKFPRELFDCIGVDSPQFERMPEMPIREVAPNRLWLLKQALKKYGYEKVPIIHTESYYPASHELALGPRGSADSYVRTAVLSLALGSTTFANCWSLQDCSDYWGSQHYGCAGVLARQPQANPKPAFAAFATMTRLLDAAQYDGYVPTGSPSAYCVRFTAQGRKIYCLWTIRGTRPATLTFAQEGNIAQVDENGNETKLVLSNLTATVTLSPTPIWVTTDLPAGAAPPGAAAAIRKALLGAPTYTEQPGKFTKRLEPLDKPWKYDPGEYGRYATNHWGAPRFAGPMKSEAVDSVERKSKVWQVVLDTPSKERPLAAWYGVFTPGKPVEIPGKARALGVWANGRSDWGRIVYEIEDAKGEIWQSVGAKDDWNCDDVHSWSYFNFDGWRYLEFPLPNHQPGDNYREMDTVWWNHNAEGVVDLPVKLARIMIEQRSHNIYVDDLLAVTNRGVQLSDLIAVYASAEAMTDAPVRLQQAAAKLFQAPKIDLATLPNPIAELRGKGVGAATTFTKVTPPDHGYDGTRVEVTIQPVEGAKEYRVYVAAHANGALAQQLVKDDKPQMLVTGLRPEFPLYLFATYMDKDGKESKPSDARRILLKDDFPMK